MSIYETNALCSFELLDEGFYLCLDDLSNKISKISSIFGYKSFPDELKLKIHECTTNEFYNKFDLFSKNYSKYIISFTCNANQIFILNYKSIRHIYSFSEYTRFIIHECIHVFQLYYSMIPPSKCIWLYEAVACYLAKQKKIFKPNKYINWNEFVNKFYHIENCYALAYNYGYLTFNFFGSDILDVIKKPFDYTHKLKNIYDNYMIIM